MSKPDGVVDALSAVDWAQPWLAPVRAAGLRCTAHVTTTPLACAGRYAAALHHAAADRQVRLPVRFVPQSHLPVGEAYEAFIARTRQVPTRDHLHDLFNGLVWQRWPHTKAQLNALQATEIARDGITARRGPVRDAITVFDENGAVLLAPPLLWHALLQRDWQALFLTHRPLWQAQARLVLFGHALMEQLVRPRKNLTAHVLVLPQVPAGMDVQALDDGDAHTWAQWDAHIAAHLKAAWLVGKPLTPLPVLGHPGWWPDNENPAFYADTAVFRPATPSVTSGKKASEKAEKISVGA